MKIEEIMRTFTDKMADIILYQRAVKETTKKELEYLDNYNSQIKNNPQLEEIPLSAHSMNFYDAKTGTLRNYGFRQTSVEERAKLVILHKNKQYGWLLAEAYEEFEDFIESIYAFMGYENNNSWLLSDYGNITLSELTGKNYEWYLSRTKNKRDKPQSILNRFRSLYPDLVKIETNNKLNVNLKVAIELIACLRHVIVHKSGVVSNRDAFAEEVLKKTGLYNNGKYDLRYKAFIEKFFGREKYHNLITLLEVSIKPEIPLDIHHDLFGELTDYLMAYATINYENISDKT